MKADLIIGGDFLRPKQGYFEVLSPLQEQPIGEAARGDASEVDLAVCTAVSGFNEWSQLAPKDREAALLRAADLIAEQGESRFLELLVEESGSVVTKARAEIAYSIDLLRTAAGEARRLYGDTFPNDNPKRLSMVFREPLGVTAILSPYNAALALLVKMVAFPLAAGNSVVIKPSEETPLTAFALVKLLLEAGLPANSVNLVSGYGAEVGQALVAHPQISAIALTGSTATGIKVGQTGIQRMLPMQLELGGKSAIVVLDDVDIAKAAQVCAQGIFTHAGQICMANSRILVHEAIFTEFSKAIKTQAQRLQVGDPWDEKSAYGPLINRQAVEKISQHIESAVAQGAEVLCGGHVKQGLFFEPTLLTDVPKNNVAWREETFGPLACLASFKHIDEAIESVNDSDYGLSSAILTNQLETAFSVARRINAGSVHIGMHAFQSNALAPIGGTGLSGIGRSGGKYSTEEFTRLKWISLALGENL